MRSCDLDREPGISKELGQKAGLGEFNSDSGGEGDRVEIKNYYGFAHLRANTESESESSREPIKDQLKCGDFFITEIRLPLNHSGIEL